LLRWLQKQVALYDKIHIEDMGASFKDGLAICAIVHRYRPDLIDFYSLNAKDAVKNNQLAFDTLEKELNIPSVRILYFLFLISLQYHTNHEHIFFSIFNVQTYLQNHSILSNFVDILSSSKQRKNKQKKI